MNPTYRAHHLTKLERQVRKSGLCARQNIRKSSAVKSEDERPAFEETLKHSKIHTPRCYEYHVSCCAWKGKSQSTTNHVEKLPSKGSLQLVVGRHAHVLE